MWSAIVTDQMAAMKEIGLLLLPGGQAEALILARQLVDKDYVVLFHLVRVIPFLFYTLMLAFFQWHAVGIQFASGRYARN